jgi:hypothetical protein
MDIILGKIADEKNKLNKTVYDAVTYSGAFKQETSIIKPVVVIEAENLSQYNYMYISDFGRYYFINEIVSLRTGLWRIYGKVDVLMSFKSSIESCPIILSNTESIANEPYMSGEIWKTLVKSKTDIINFPSGLNSTGEYILITSGG